MAVQVLQYQISAADKQFIDAIIRSGRAINNLDRDVQKAGAGIEQTFKRIAQGAGLVFGLAQLKQFALEVINVRSEFQNTEAAFKVFLGDMDKSKALMKDLQKYAFNNVFEFKDLTGQAAQLLAYQNSVEDVIPILDKLSNVAAGVNQPLERFVELYNKAKSRDKLTMIDVQQWSVMGDVLSDLGIMLGKSREEIQKMVSTGKIGFKEIDDLLNQMTGSGGRFHGMMEEKMKTLGDSIGLLQDSISAMFNEIGENSQEMLRGGILAANYLVEHYETIGKILIGLIATYGSYKAAVIAVTVVEQMQTIARLAHIKGMTTWGLVTDILNVKLKALNKTMLANPYVLATVVIVGLVSAMWAFNDSATAAERAQKRLNDSIDEFNKKEEDRKAKAEQLIRTIQDETATDLQKFQAYEELKKVSSELTEVYTQEQIATLDLAKARGILNQKTDANSFQDLNEQLKTAQERLQKLKKYKGASTNTLGEEWHFFAGMVTQNDIDEQISLINQLQEKIRDYERQIKESAEKAKPIEIRIKEAENNEKAAKKAFDNAKAALDKAEAENGGGLFMNVKLRLEYEQAKSVFNRAKSLLQGLINEQQQKPLITQAVQLSNAQSDLATLKKQKAELSGIKMSDEDRLKKLKEINDEIKKQEELITLLGGGGGKSDKLNKQLEERKKAQEKYAEEITQLVLDTEAKQIAAQKDGLQKQLAELDHSFNQEKAKLNKQVADMIETYNKAHGTKITTEAQLPQETQDVLNSQRLAAEAVYQTNRTKLEKEAQKEIRRIRQETFDQNKTELDKEIANINRSYEERIKQAEEAGMSELEIQTLIQQQDKEIEDAKKRSALKSLEFETQIQVAETELMYQSVSLREIGEREKTKALLDGLKERLAILKTMSGEEVEAEIKQIEQAIKGYEKALKKPLSLTSQINDKILGGFAKMFGGGKEGEEKATKLFDAIEEKAGIAADAIGMLKNVFGGLNEDLDAALNTIGSIAQGFATGGIAGGIMSIASSVFSLIGNNAKVREEVRKANEEQARKMIDMQTAVNKLLLEELRTRKDIKNLLMPDDYFGTTRASIEAAGKAVRFFNDETKKSADSYKSLLNAQSEIYARNGFAQSKYLKEAVDAQREALNGMSDLEVALSSIDRKTGSKKVSSGFLGLGSKKVDTFAKDLLEKYPQLIDEQGLLNTELANAILQNETLDETGKQTLQNLITYTEEYKAAMEQLDGVVSDIFGNIGNSLADALIEGFKAGENGLYAFEDSFKSVMSGMIDKLAMNSIVNAIFGTMLNDYGEKIKEAMTTGNHIDITEILGNLSEDLKSAYDVAEESVKAYDEAKRQAGLGGVGETGSGEREGMTGQGLAQASQDSINELSGRMLANNILLSEVKTIAGDSKLQLIMLVAQMNGLNDNSISLISIARDQLAVQTLIKHDTARLQTIEEGINSMNIHGVKVQMQ